METGGLHLASPDYYRDAGRDRFEDFETNPVKRAAETPVSTFSIDVDTTSYSFVRRMLNSGVLPQKDAVRIEEMINYFDYAYPLPASRERPFEPSVALAPSPWARDKLLMHIGIKGFDVAADEKPRSNLVFLIDVSGSMDAADKLPPGQAIPEAARGWSGARRHRGHRCLRGRGGHRSRSHQRRGKGQDNRGPGAIERGRVHSRRRRHSSSIRARGKPVRKGCRESG